MRTLPKTSNIFELFNSLSSLWYKLLALLLLINSTICIAEPAVVGSPVVGESITRRGQVFTFVPVGATQYFAYIGSAAGARDIQSINLGLNTSFKVSDIPIGVDRVHVRLWSLIDNRWSSNSYVYRVATQVYYPQLNGSIALHSAQLWGVSWSDPVAYSELDTNVACDDPMSTYESSCNLSLNLNSRDDAEYNRAIGSFVNGAVSALINVKLKVWAMAENAYCQIALTAGQNSSQLEFSDFLAHIEVFGDKDWRLSGRRITYTAIPFPVDLNGNFVIKLNKEIIGACQVSVAFNVLGVYK